VLNGCGCELVEAKYVKPSFSEETLQIIHGRYPLLKQIEDGFVPNSTEFESQKSHVRTDPKFGLRTPPFISSE
jgi:hypothetical protein